MQGQHTKSYTLTCTPMFAGGHGHPVPAQSIISAVRAFEEIGWKRVKAKVSRSKFAGRSRAVVRFRDPKSRCYANLVFTMEREMA